VERSNKARWLELGLTIFVSTLASILSVTWTMSHKIATIEAQLADHQRHIDATQDIISAASKYGAATQGQVIKESTELSEVMRRLARIEEKLDSKK